MLLSVQCQGIFRVDLVLSLSFHNFGLESGLESSLFMKGQKTRTHTSPGKAGLNSPLGVTGPESRSRVPTIAWTGLPGPERQERGWSRRSALSWEPSFSLTGNFAEKEERRKRRKIIKSNWFCNSDIRIAIRTDADTFPKNTDNTETFHVSTRSEIFADTDF
jgi:hypothetical protein